MTRAVRKAARAPSYAGFAPRSARASSSARGASRKIATKPEVLLRDALSEHRLKYETNVSALPGCPDIVFQRARLAVFVDGDFWHGRKLASRLEKLGSGHNASYWVPKLLANVARDRKHSRELRRLGWRTMRLWETDVRRDPGAAAARVLRRLKAGPKGASRSP